MHTYKSLFDISDIFFQRRLKIKYVRKDYVFEKQYPVYNCNTNTFYRTQIKIPL